MEKPAPVRFPIHELLARRWSPRAFDERPIEPEKLKSLFEAARWAPSSNNEQPWRFLVATKDRESEWNRLFACLLEGNRQWAYRAPVLILSVASLNFEDDVGPNRHALHDTGMATENLALQATALDLVAHPMAGFDVEKARTDLKIPAGCEPVAIIAVGYPGDHLWWNPQSRSLGAPTRLVWRKHALVDSIRKLLEYRFEWVLAGHGDRVRLPVEEMRNQLRALVACRTQLPAP